MLKIFTKKTVQIIIMILLFFLIFIGHLASFDVFETNAWYLYIIIAVCGILEFLILLFYKKHSFSKRIISTCHYIYVFCFVWDIFLYAVAYRGSSILGLLYTVVTVDVLGITLTVIFKKQVSRSAKIQEDGTQEPLSGSSLDTEDDSLSYHSLEKTNKKPFEKMLKTFWKICVQIFITLFLLIILLIEHIGLMFEFETTAWYFYLIIAVCGILEFLILLFYKKQSFTKKVLSICQYIHVFCLGWGIFTCVLFIHSISIIMIMVVDILGIGLTIIFKRQKTD